MPIQFDDPKTTRIMLPDRNPSTENIFPQRRRLVPTSDDIAGIELRMLPPFIRDNRTPRFLFFPGNARLYCFTMVISDVSNQLTGMMDLNALPAVGDNELLPINKTLFYWEKNSAAETPPHQLHVMCSVIKSKERLRDVGDILTTIQNDDEYKNLLDELASFAADTANLTVITNISLHIANIAGRYMGRVDDKPIGTAINSFTRLYGDWDQLGIKQIPVATKNVDFHYELIVRDNKKQEV